MTRALFFSRIGAAFLCAVAVVLAFAPEAALAAASEDAVESAAAFKRMGIAIGFGLAGLGAAVGIGILAGRLLEAIARQPELEGKLMGRFFLTVGLTDAVPIIAIALGFALLFI
jgi:F-type H+-transporting ATPase subunit c